MNRFFSSCLRGGTDVGSRKRRRSAVPKKTKTARASTATAKLNRLEDQVFYQEEADEVAPEPAKFEQWVVTAKEGVGARMEADLNSERTGQRLRNGEIFEVFAKTDPDPHGRVFVNLEGGHGLGLRSGRAAVRGAAAEEGARRAVADAAAHRGRHDPSHPGRAHPHLPQATEHARRGGEGGQRGQAVVRG